MFLMLAVCFIKRLWVKQMVLTYETQVVRIEQ